MAALLEGSEGDLLGGWMEELLPLMRLISGSLFYWFFLSLALLDLRIKRTAAGIQPIAAVSCCPLTVPRSHRARIPHLRLLSPSLHSSLSPPLSSIGARSSRPVRNHLSQKSNVRRNRHSQSPCRKSTGLQPTSAYAHATSQVQEGGCPRSMQKCIYCS